MTESTFDDIFDDLIDPNEELQNFLSIFEALLPEASTLLVSEAGVLLAGARPLVLAQPERERLVREAGATDGFVAGETEDGAHCQAVYLAKLSAVLIFSCAAVRKDDLLSGSMSAFLLWNTIDLALSRQEREMLVADHEQAVRQINILQQQHGKLIEDNYRQYRLNQDREKEYARKLESEIAKQTAELREANVRLEEISRLKSDFLANMSHELRTPLNAVIGFADIMRQQLFGPLPARYADYSESIHSAGGHLLDLINDVLDVTKIEAEKYELDKEKFDAREPVSAAMTLVRGRAHDKGVELSGLLPPDAMIVEADKRALKQMALNLLSNAVKFTPEGGTVTVTLEAVGPYLELIVADTGVGIAPEDLNRLGRPFEQAGDASQKAQGTGLGLSLVRSLAELHGGRMTIESTLGEGAAVTVRMPVVKIARAPAPEGGAEIVPLAAARSGGGF